MQQPDDATSILTWAHAGGASRYEVQVDDDAGFGSPYATVQTVNNTYIPTMNLKSGTNFWRVRALNSASESSSWSDHSFGNPALKVPVPASPAEGAVLVQPANPPLLSWTGVPSATSYSVEVDGDNDFVGAFSYTTQTTSLVVPDPLQDGDWYWRVTASKGPGFASMPSNASRFVISPLAAPTITSPPDNPDIELQDVVLDWAPVPGAKSYDVQVATNTDFTVGGSLIEEKLGILGTRYSPPITYNNNQYFWRVRAVDLTGHATPWTESHFSFNRTYPYVPEPVYPAKATLETVGAPFHFQWRSVKHASEYELQVGTQSNFSAGTFDSCRIAGTTFTPGAFAVNTNGQPSTNRINEDCLPQAGAINYWRVRPLDRPRTQPGEIPGVQGLYSPTHSFIYQPLSVKNLSPSGGETVDVPTLTWDPVIGAETYEIRIRRANGSEVDSATTSSTSYTMDGTTPLDPANNPHRWEIMAVNAKGERSVNYINTFNVSGSVPSEPEPGLTPLSPTSSTPGIQQAPSLTWSPLPAAHHYAVLIGNATDEDPATPGPDQVWFGHGAGDLFGQPVPYPAMTDTSKRLLEPGSYDWKVMAFAADDTILATGPEGRFTVQPLTSVTGHAVALDGGELALFEADPPTGTPCVPGSGPCTVPATPVLRWTPDVRASFYMVYVSEDASFTNLIEPSSAIPATANTYYAPTLDNQDHTYADNQAGQAYYWHIRPCRTIGNCGPDPVSTIGNAQHSFVKQSPAVGGDAFAGSIGLTSSSPAGTEITFSWDNYFDTNRAALWARTGEERPQAAKQYRIQVDDDLSFAAPLVDERVVDQTTYTAFDRLYPEGTFHWRVQAIDSDDNGLTWSTVKTFTKQSPQVSLTSPVGQQVVAGTTPLRWASQAFASSYEVEVYKNNDATFSSANKVFGKTNLKTPAYAHNVPLSPSPQPYIWRVRRTDADGNKGPWSEPGRFLVSSGAMSIVSPANGGSQPANAPVLQWAPVAGASTYAVQVRPASGSGATVNTTTVASGYAAVSTLGTGTYVWTVTAKDPGGNAIGSAEGTFSVDASVGVVQGAQIHAPTGTGVGQTVTSTLPTWNQAGVTSTYQWLRDGANIGGATAATYVLSAADYGKSVSLKVTGKKDGFSDGTSVSNSIGVSAGGALQATAPPAITGTAVVGNSLRVSTGSWAEPGGTFGYQWLRTGAPIPGATTPSYTLKPGDAGKDISATVTARKAGFSDGAAAAAAVAVPKLVSSTVATLSKTRTSPAKRVKIGITVTVPGVKGPVGPIKVYDGAKRLKTLTLVSTRDGKIGWRLPKLKVGKHKIKAVYSGNASTASSKSKIVKLYVVR
ncbi:hypothetical protein DDE18_10235 [Nocardioides gansuensis]|uniref:Bacterial Ig-like domain-containing protein n=1 Tax=Nocardioides gansuensis TaxID=2138300 RepID=A0A2T8FAK0_9ACTN|nr:hypothetical protein DDE18_10235 [Nocardioides gansuensis]